MKDHTARSAGRRLGHRGTDEAIALDPTLRSQGRFPGQPETLHGKGSASELLGDEDSDSGFRVLSWTLRNRPESR